jgi:hypothetical protein
MIEIVRIIQKNGVNLPCLYDFGKTYMSIENRLGDDDNILKICINKNMAACLKYVPPSLSPPPTQGNIHPLADGRCPRANPTRHLSFPDVRLQFSGICSRPFT